MSELPTPDPDSQAHSERVLSHIVDRIRSADGFLSFAEFMHECLYAPGLGYYAAGSRKLGHEGDFVTAPELTPLFGRLLAGQLVDVLKEFEESTILELGAGTGELAVQVLKTLETKNALPASYRILEVSADLRERQQRYIATELPDIDCSVEWVDSPPGGIQGAIIANEVLDALPFERFEICDGGVLQHGVGIDEDQLVWSQRAAPDALVAAVRELEREQERDFEDGFVSDICLAARPWVEDLISGLDSGLALFIDYGVDQRTYYRADRSGGWLQCYFRHHVHDDPLVLTGIQDITSWVDFTQVASGGVAAGATVAGYVSQAHFLMGAGLESELQNLGEMPDVERAKLASAVKMLMMPGEMGEHVKCIGLTRNARTPIALSEMDRTHLL